MAEYQRVWDNATAQPTLLRKQVAQVIGRPAPPSRYPSAALIGQGLTDLRKPARGYEVEMRQPAALLWIAKAAGEGQTDIVVKPKLNRG